MKRKISFLTAIVLSLITFFSCTPEKEEYPVAYIIRGPHDVFQTSTIDYEAVPAWEQAGTTWAWTVTGATLKNVSSDTKTAKIEFNTMPPSGKAVLTVTETTSAGVKSGDTVLEITVKKFCAFDINNFIGAFDCDEAGYGVYGVNFTKHATLVNTIVNNNFWDWPGPNAVVYYTLSGDFLEKVTVPQQSFQFGDGYVGWVKGSGKYNSCSQTMIIDYTVFYDGDEYSTHHEFAPAKKGMMYPIPQKKSREYFR